MNATLEFDDSSITVALVGCGGFIGSHLLPELLERTRWRIFGVDLDSYRIQQYLTNDRFNFLCADLADPEVVQRIAQYPVVINLAAICTPGRYMAEAAEVIRSNYNHPAALADACAKNGCWLIHFSTSEIYGKTACDSGALVEDESEIVLGPVSASRWSYATAKLLTERYLAGLPQLKWTVLRPFNFVGPFMDFMPGVDGEGIPRVLANFSTALVRGETLKLVNGGVARRCFTSIHDAIDFMFRLFAVGGKPAFSQAFNIGNPDNEVSIAELAQMMRNVFAKIKDISESDVPGVEEVAGEAYYGKGYDDSMRRLPSVEKAEDLLNFRAKIPLREALEESLSWFTNYYAPVNE